VNLVNRINESEKKKDVYPRSYTNFTKKKKKKRRRSLTQSEEEFKEEFKEELHRVFKKFNVN